MFRHSICHLQGVCSLRMTHLGVETCRSLIIYILFIIVFSLVELQIIPEMSVYYKLKCFGCRTDRHCRYLHDTGILNCPGVPTLALGSAQLPVQGVGVLFRRV